MLEYFSEDLNHILNHTKKFKKEFKDKTVFLTGGTGFFGVWLQMSFIHLNRTLNLNSKLIVLTRNKEKFINNHNWLDNYSEVRFLEGDIINFDFIDEEIDYIIHAATEASVKLNIEEPLTMFDTVVNGTKRILEFAKIKKVESLLFTSSGAVYGAQPSSIENISENYSGAPNASEASSVYGEGKRMAEVLCAVYHKHYNVPVKVARCYAFIGPFLALDSHFAAGNFISNIIKGEDIIIKGDGTPKRSYMYSADLMIWLWTILFKGRNNSPYNVGSDQSMSIQKLAELVAKVDDSRVTQVLVKTPISNKPIERYVPDTTKASKELNLKVYLDVETSIKKTIEFNKNML
jgi:nucleoside-diphosphate-sugar epimerase